MNQKNKNDPKNFLGKKEEPKTSNSNPKKPGSKNFFKDFATNTKNFFKKSSQNLIKSSKSLKSKLFDKKAASSKKIENKQIQAKQEPNKKERKDFWDKSFLKRFEKPKSSNPKWKKNPLKDLPSINNLEQKKEDIIAKSIPIVNSKKKVRFTGFSLLMLIWLTSLLFLIFYIIAAVNSPSIGIGSYSNKNFASNQAFFLLINDFWVSFVLNNNKTIYSFFNSISTNINNASNSAVYLFALSFYISMFMGLFQLIFVFVLAIISIIQKNFRNFWIAIFSLIPFLGNFLCLYYLGVLHYDITFWFQKIINKERVVVEQEKNLNEQIKEVIEEKAKAPISNENKNPNQY